LEIWIRFPYLWVMDQENTAIPHVTEEEKGWIKALSEGKKAKDVAYANNINEGTFAYKLNVLRGRFNCDNTNGLIAYFLRNKLID